MSNILIFKENECENCHEKTPGQIVTKSNGETWWFCAYCRSKYYAITHIELKLSEESIKAMLG